MYICYQYCQPLTVYLSIELQMLMHFERAATSVYVSPTTPYDAVTSDTFDVVSGLDQARPLKLEARVARLNDSSLCRPLRGNMNC